MIKSLKHWIADRRELVRRMVELEGIIIGLRDDRQTDALTIADMTAERDAALEDAALWEQSEGVCSDLYDRVVAERDAALAKLAPPARDAATGRWARK